ncbi:hypothetical protein [Streptomyces sp. NPDC008265]|uniref:hypothetical protein n=1 Tax=Streptomyces sp. NPDC008265 TaxID=3364824 RepID=UPI0036E989E2
MSLLPGRIWSDEEWERIQRGYVAQDMDQKWHVLVEGDTAFLHRSWTRFGVYEATFALVDGGGRRIVSALVERDGDRYRNTDDDYDSVMLELVISAIVLGEPAAELRSRLVESTSRKAGTDAPPAVVQHSALGLRSDS